VKTLTGYDATVTFHVEGQTMGTYKVTTQYAGIFAPVDEMDNPNRKWWQFWKPKKIKDPSYWDKMANVFRGDI